GKIRRVMKIEFEASLPPIASAITLDGQGGARIKMDVPEIYMDAILAVSKLTGRSFRVIIEEIGQA
ncbi:MAG: hypothetical protein ACOYWZ_23330, partial [Bacillota bacterium]